LCRESGQILIDSDAVETLVGLSDGDARCALSGLEFIVNAKLVSDRGTNKRHVISNNDVKNGLVRSHIVYDRLGKCSSRVVSSNYLEVRLNAKVTFIWHRTSLMLNQCIGDNLLKTVLCIICTWPLAKVQKPFSANSVLHENTLLMQCLLKILMFQFQLVLETS